MRNPHKKYFTFYHSYYDVMEGLSTEEKECKFLRTLLDVQFKTGNTIELANKVDFKDEELNKAWQVVKNQLSKRDRSTTEYAHWRKSVFERDNYTCIVCNSTDNLNAHHIIRWVDSIELRFELSNGATLCYSCHRKVHNKDIEL